MLGTPAPPSAGDSWALPTADPTPSAPRSLWGDVGQGGLWCIHNSRHECNTNAPTGAQVPEEEITVGLASGPFEAVTDAFFILNCGKRLLTLQFTSAACQVFIKEQSLQTPSC